MSTEEKESLKQNLLQYYFTEKENRVQLKKKIIMGNFFFFFALFVKTSLFCVIPSLKQVEVLCSYGFIMVESVLF